MIEMLLTLAFIMIMSMLLGYTLGKVVGAKGMLRYITDQGKLSVDDLRELGVDNADND